MELLEAMGLLLSRSEERARFRHDAAALADAWEIPTHARESFLALGMDELEAQARTLLGKRRHEVFSLVPELGACERWVLLFDEYAQTYWPEGHRRHLEDAVGFCEFLRARGERGLPRARINLIRFELAAGRRRFHFVADAPVRGRARAALQLLSRGPGGAVSERYLCLR